MFRRKISVMMVCLLCLGATSFAQGAMTDEDVLEYVKQAASEGRSQNEIVRALSLRGVDAEQVRRVERLYREQQDSDNVAETATSRGHYTYANEEVPETATSYQDEDLGEALAVYGRDVFRNRNLNFAPSENLATPKNYRLGPGDEVIIEIYGSNQKTIRGTISPEGSINTEYLGPIYLNGMTIDEANSYLRRRLGQVYGGLLNNESDLRLSLGQIRTIQVNILGDVHNPGTFHLSSFSTVFHALYRAGGIVEPGSLRDISVVRNGKTVATVDVYDFLTNGNRSSDIRLEEGDVILVRPYKIMVKADGKLKRPMYFEMKPGETFTDLLNYAGGFANSAYTESITVTRQNGKSYEVRTVYESEYDSFKLQNGDEIQVGELTSLFENKLTIVGSVYRPSVYELGKDCSRAVRPFKDALNFGVIFLSNDSHAVAAFCQFFRRKLSPFDVRASRVDDLQALRPNFFVNLRTNAVRTNYDRAAARFVKILNHAYAFSLQPFDHLRIVNYRSERAACAASIRLRNVYRPLHAVAKSQVFR